jgi:hypothetical protein
MTWPGVRLCISTSRNINYKFANYFAEGVGRILMDFFVSYSSIWAVKFDGLKFWEKGDVFMVDNQHETKQHKFLNFFFVLTYNME